MRSPPSPRPVRARDPVVRMRIPPSARDLHWHSLRVRMRISSAARRGAGNLNLVRPHADATISAEPTTSTWSVRMRIPQSARCRRIQPEPSACGRNHRLGRFRAHRPTPSACGFLNYRDVGGLKPEPAHAGATIARAGSVHIGSPVRVRISSSPRRRRPNLVRPHADFSIIETSAA